MIEMMKERKLDVFIIHLIESMSPMSLSTEDLRSTVHWGYRNIVNCVSGPYSPLKGRDDSNNVTKQQELNTGLEPMLLEQT